MNGKKFRSVIFLDANLSNAVLVPCVCDGNMSIGISWASLKNTLACAWSMFWTRLRANVNNWKGSQWALELRMKVPLIGQEATVNCAVWPTRKRSMGILYLVQQGLKAFFYTFHQLASFLRLGECSSSGFRCNLRVWFPEFTAVLWNWLGWAMGFKNVGWFKTLVAMQVP